MSSQIEDYSQVTNQIDQNERRYQLYEGASYHREVRRDLTFEEDPHMVD